MVNKNLAKKTGDGDHDVDKDVELEVEWRWRGRLEKRTGSAKYMVFLWGRTKGDKRKSSLYNRKRQKK